MKYYESRRLSIVRIWAWYQRRLGYITEWVVRHFGHTTYLCRARKPNEQPRSWF